MNEMNDEELQQWLENKRPLLGDGDLNGEVKAYQNLFEILDNKPVNILPYGFNKKVTRHIQHEAKRNSEFKFHLLATVVFIGSIAVICGLMTFFNPGITFVLMRYKWILVLVPLVFIAIQYVDQKLVKSDVFR